MRFASHFLNWVVAALLASPVFAAPIPVAAQTSQAPEHKPFAVVGDTTISHEEYQAAFAASMRQKYYHARPPENELAAFQREVGNQLVDRVLLLREARKRGIQPDRKQIDKTIAEYDRRYATSERWQANRDKMVPQLVEQLERQSLLEQIERQARTAPAPSAAQARAYYDRHKEQFTEPEQVRMSLILLRVDPSAPKVAWDKAREEAERLHQRLGRGADFAELARLHSADPSAEKGGDLGYLHRGMLPEAIQTQLVDTLKPGEVSLPVTLLEGIAIVRLEDRKAPQLRGYEDVRQRAAELAQREAADERWKRLIADLRSRTRIRLDESRYLPLTAK